MSHRFPSVTAGAEPLATRVAARIRGFDRSMVSPRALKWARMAITDTVAVTLAGIPEDCVGILLRTPGVAEAPGASPIFGTRHYTSMLDAALVNGTASHALDYDDISQVMGGHPSAPLVAGLFALGMAQGLSGGRIALAYLVGVETEQRLSRAVNFLHYDKGWHPTATLGVFGAAAACAYALDLDQTQTAASLGMAASLAAGVKANFGTMTKPLHVGHCARNGLWAALLAQGGFTANPRALEHHQGFLNVFNGPGQFDEEALWRGWWQPPEIEDPGVGLKQFPCCGSTHASIAAALMLVNEEGIVADDIAHITILPHPRRLKHTDNPFPASPLQAKFSVQYGVARALLSGAVRLEDFDAGAYQAPAICRLLERTTARAHPDMHDDDDRQWGAEVIIDLNDGRRLSRHVANLTGRGPDDPMSETERWEKFRDCARRVLPMTQIEPLFGALSQLERQPDVRLLADWLAGDVPVGRGRPLTMENT